MEQTVREGEFDVNDGGNRRIKQGDTALAEKNTD